MSSYDDNYYINLLVTFEINHLQSLLTTFCRSKNGTHKVLLNRAINVLLKRPSGINRQLFLTKINEIYQSMQNEINVSNNEPNMGTTLIQQQVMPLDMQTQIQRRIPQYSQHPVQYILQTGLPQVIPQTQRFIEPNMGTILIQQPVISLDMQTQVQRMIPQYYQQQPPLILQAGLPQVIPQTQRGIEPNMGTNNEPNMGTTLIQQQVMPLDMQTQIQRRIPQYSQQPPQYILQAELPQVIPQTQKDESSQVSRTPLQQQPIQVSPHIYEVYGTNSSNTGNSFTNSFISPQSPPNIRIQKLPFFEVVAECIKPTILNGTESCSLSSASEGMREAVFSLVMEPSQVNYISDNRDVSNGNPEYLYRAQIRICLLEEGSTEATDLMPIGLHIRINDKTCRLPPAPQSTRSVGQAIVRRTARPIYCTQLLMLNPLVTQTILVNWCPDGQKYVIAMHIVRKLTSKILLMKLKEKPARSVEETKNDIIRKLTNGDPDLATTSYCVSLMCPIGQVKMNLPAKSGKCDHLQCFDAEAFILMNERKPTWMCPICNKPCLYDDIHIETYFLEIVTSRNLADCSKEIELLSDGTWRVFEKKLEKSADTKAKLMDSVNLDDDNPKEFKKRKCSERT